MKILVATVALVTLVTAPALAQSNRQRVVEPPAYQAFGWQAPGQAYGYDAYAYQYGRVGNPNNVYSISGRYIGTDPDPRVRSMLAHDPPNGD